jgi:uncharacterized membrane protein YciS (DUF1049 family)
MLRWLVGIVLVVGIAAGIFVGALNPDPVTLDLVAVRWSVSLGTVVVAGFAVGLVIGIALTAISGLFRARGPRAPASGKAPAKRLDDG